MTFRLAQRRLIWCPTLLGWFVLLALLSALFAVWWFEGEAFLATTQRQPAEVLVVESWIGRDGLEAALAEFNKGGYLYLVTSGGLSNNDWDGRRWNYAKEAGDLLVRLGVPAERILEAPAEDTKRQRTFAAAVAVRQSLESRGLHPAAVNVFTIGAHARRSRLVFAKVLPASAKVGVISWVPPRHQRGPWWKSSERAEDVIKETVGYLIELLLNSGRVSNTAGTGER